MNVLIVFAHPSEESLNAAIKDAAVESLIERGASVKVSDLYRMNFNPVAQLSDVVVPTDTNLINEDLFIEREKVRWADYIIFQFPIWWTSTPAIVKGWFDRVFAAGFAYGPGIYNHGNLKGKKAMLSITIGGKDLGSYGPKGLKGEMNERLFSIQHEILYFAGMEVIEPFIVASGASYEARLDFINQMKSRMNSIENLPIIQFLPLEAYENGQLKEGVEEIV
ncbi:NAD(P)H-dependent oxidoreductase [Fredinandcohnia humi]